MTLYYVSAQRGNDTNNGTAPATPWATITKAVGEVAAGDTVYIGPGTYREKPALTTAGTDGNPITWMPDSQVEYVTGDKPGIVRVTGCDVDEKATNGVVWACNVDYNTVGDIDKGFNQAWIDGSRNDYTSLQDAIGNGKLFNGVVFHGASAIRRGIGYNCVAVGGQFAFRGADVTNCVAVGGDYAFLGGNIKNSIGVAGQYGSRYTSSNTNVIIIGGRYGYVGVPCTNCVALGSFTGFLGTAVTAPLNICRAIACMRSFHGTDSESLLDVSTCSYVWHSTIYQDHTTENATEAKAVLYDFAKIAEMLQPLLQFNLNDGDNTASAGDFDIRGIARRLGDGTIDIGAIEHTLSTLDFTNIKTQEPAVKIQRAGMEKFTFWAEGGVEFTKKVWTKWANVTGDKPQIVVDGAHVTRASGTATGDGTDWEELTVSATPSADGEVEVYLYARDTGVDAVVYFSDLE